MCISPYLLLFLKSYLSKLCNIKDTELLSQSKVRSKQDLSPWIMDWKENLSILHINDPSRTRIRITHRKSPTNIECGWSVLLLRFSIGTKLNFVAQFTRQDLFYASSTSMVSYATHQRVWYNENPIKEHQKVITVLLTLFSFHKPRTHMFTP